MSIALTTLDTSNASHTFQTLVARVNDLINNLGNNVVTTANTANGGFTAGNVYLQGFFSAQTISVPLLQGGNAASPGLLVVTGNVSFTNSLITTSNATFYFGANTSANNKANTTGFYGSVFKAGNNQLDANGITIGGTLYSSLVSSINVTFGNTSTNTAKLRFINGNDVDIGYVVNASANAIDLTFNVSANAGLGVVGANTQIQFNDSGAFGATAGLTFTKTSNTLNVDNWNGKKSLYQYGEAGTVRLDYDTVSNTSVIDALDITSFGAAEYIVTAQASSTNNKQVSTILILNTGNDVVYTEYGSIVSNNDVIALSANANTTHIKLNLSSPISNCTIRAYRRLVTLA